MKFSIIKFVWKLKIFSKAIFRMQPSTWKYIPFLLYSENILYVTKHILYSSRLQQSSTWKVHVKLFFLHPCISMLKQYLFAKESFEAIHYCNKIWYWNFHHKIVFILIQWKKKKLKLKSQYANSYIEKRNILFWKVSRLM